MTKSIVHEALSGLYLISGLYGSGKSTMAMSLEDPALTVMIDMDQKSAARAKGLGISRYYAPEFVIESPEDYDRLAILEWSQKAFQQLKADYDGQTTIVIDNGSMLEDAFHLSVSQDPIKYGVNPENARSGRYGGTNPGVAKIWKNLTIFLTNLGFKHIVVTMHMSEMWAGGAPVQKYRVRGNKALTELSNLSLVLARASRPNTAPRAIVGKEALSLMSFLDGEFKVYMALPPAIPECTWRAIYKYIDGAPERTEFTKDEIPSAKDIERYGPWLTDEQKELIMSVAKNPNFGVTDEDAAAALAANRPSLKSWDDVKEAAVRNLGVASLEAARVLMQSVFAKGMTYEEVYEAMEKAK